MKLYLHETLNQKLSIESNYMLTYHVKAAFSLFKSLFDETILQYANDDGIKHMDFMRSAQPQFLQIIYSEYKDAQTFIFLKGLSFIQLISSRGILK